MAGTLIQPLKINRPTGRALPQLNIAADFGVERNVASKIEELFQKKQKQDLIPVSYTHLTLPTICSV